eukprot:CAMPEP_0115000554 /NCGR_PEP_ID=MMETSP0216-20121206/16829_1 /TAXON_ID=223996 /ORGANISM="Protocruzia adherens, Strain Boccale" /LENGTH=207 /DNA_ID=CAMNT_0002365679 /DNA_START=985 /DNA_END=1608 /DNA_ORIENTATION=+
MAVKKPRFEFALANERSELEVNRQVTLTIAKSLNGLLESYQDSSSRSVRRASFLQLSRPLSHHLQLYVQRIVTGVNCSPHCYVMIMVYLERIAERISNFAVTKGNIHALFATTLLVTLKFHEDNTPTNRMFSTLSSIPIDELNKFELEIMKALDWDLKIDRATFKQYRQFFLASYAEFHAESQQKRHELVKKVEARQKTNFSGACHA